MKCPHCGHENSKVIESREAGDSVSIRRRRECLSCSHRYTTYERIERPNLAIIKKDGVNRELYDRDKLFRAIHRSVGKFFSSDVEIEEMVARVEDKLYNLGTQEVPSRQIGELVMEELVGRNKVAYVRFASVYQEFTSVSEFEKVLRELREKTNT